MSRFPHQAGPFAPPFVRDSATQGACSSLAGDDIVIIRQHSKWVEQVCDNATTQRNAFSFQVR